MQQYEKNKRNVWRILKKNGLNDKVAAGMMGNIEVETGGTFDYRTKQKNGPGQGLFQLQGAKKKAYKHFLQIKKLTDKDYEDSAEAQIEFFLNTIDEDPEINLNKNTVGPGNIKKINNAFKTGTVDEITQIVSQLWQIAGKSHMDRRLEAAHNYEVKFSKPEQPFQMFSMNKLNKCFQEAQTETMNDFLKKMKQRLETGTLQDFLTDMKQKNEKKNEIDSRYDDDTDLCVGSNDYGDTEVCDVYGNGGHAYGWTGSDNCYDNDDNNVDSDVSDIYGYGYGDDANILNESDDDTDVRVESSDDDPYVSDNDDPYVYDDDVDFSGDDEPYVSDDDDVDASDEYISDDNDAYVSDQQSDDNDDDDNDDNSDASDDYDYDGYNVLPGSGNVCSEIDTNSGADDNQYVPYGYGNNDDSDEWVGSYNHNLDDSYEYGYGDDRHDCDYYANDDIDDFDLDLGNDTNVCDDYDDDGGEFEIGF